MYIRGHVLDLLDADPVLAGDGAAQLDAGGENLVGGREHPLHLVGVVLVKKEDGVDVAVAGVKDVGDPQSRGARPTSVMIRRMSGSLVRGTTPSCVT